MNVVLGPEGPAPGDATIAWGDTVTFTNADSKLHQITIPRLNLSSPEIGPGGTWVHVFDGRRGNYGYRVTGGGPNKLATIVVDLKGSVTLAASSQTVRWGRPLKLSGKSSFPGTAVTLAERLAGSGRPWSNIARTEANADGAFTFELKPERGMQYRAQVAADQITSPTLRVSVVPTITIRAKVRRARVGKIVTITARVNPPHAATALDLQRFNPQRVRWHTDGRLKTSASGAVTFRWKAVQGRTRLRVAVQNLALRDGWAETISPSVTITGVK
jgi:hypothetical protein